MFQLQISRTPQGPVITTVDPQLTSLGLPQYPPLPGNVEPGKVEEIRRTVYVSNLDQSVSVLKQIILQITKLL